MSVQVLRGALTPCGPSTRSGEHGFVEEAWGWLCMFSSNLKLSQTGSEEMAFGVDWGWSLKSKEQK